MSVNTIFFLTKKDLKIEDIYASIEKRYENAFLYKNRITFKDNKDKRMLYIDTNRDLLKEETGIDGFYCSLGYWGNSVLIAKFLLDKFGGYIKEKDSDNIEMKKYNWWEDIAVVKVKKQELTFCNVQGYKKIMQ